MHCLKICIQDDILISTPRAEPMTGVLNWYIVLSRWLTMDHPFFSRFFQNKQTNKKYMDNIADSTPGNPDIGSVDKML